MGGAPATTAMPRWIEVPARPRLRLANAHVPSCLLDEVPDRAAVDRDGLATVDIDIVDGRIAAVAPAGATEMPADAAVVELDRGQVWPGFVDMHTHLDKGHIWPRAENPDGTFEGAINSVRADRDANWTAEDIAARMNFALEGAYAHGTVAIRTHLDSYPPHDRLTWQVFDEIRRAWARRIDLQPVTIVHIDYFADEADAAALADVVRAHDGVLGAVVDGSTDEEPLLIERLFRLAAERDLPVDLHVDEHGRPGASALPTVAETAMRLDFGHQVVCGHCCALAVQPQPVIERTMKLVADAGLGVVSLPMCNLYLQDRTPGRSPHWRGPTLVHELAAQGTPVALASDNCRDPFYGYGDLDGLEVFTQAARICHLDRPVGAWPRAVTATPAQLMGLAERGRIAAGLPADLVVFAARSYAELLSRPQADRVVLRDGRAIERRLPDYRALDHLFNAHSS